MTVFLNKHFTGYYGPQVDTVKALVLVKDADFYETIYNYMLSFSKFSKV